MHFDLGQTSGPVISLLRALLGAALALGSILLVPSTGHAFGDDAQSAVIVQAAESSPSRTPACAERCLALKEPTLLRDRREPTWYGWQTLIADALSLSAFVGGAASGSTGLLLPSFVSWMLATPIVHAVHGNIGRAFLSAGLRAAGIAVTAATVFVVALSALGSESGAGYSPVWMVVAAAVGILGPAAIDAAALAYEQPPLQSAGLRVAPFAALGARSFGLSVASSW